MFLLRSGDLGCEQLHSQPRLQALKDSRIAYVSVQAAWTKRQQLDKKV
jgi:hypothetical protein